MLGLASTCERFSSRSDRKSAKWLVLNRKSHKTAANPSVYGAVACDPRVVENASLNRAACHLHEDQVARVKGINFPVEQARYAVGFEMQNSATKLRMIFWRLRTAP